eukprot:1065783_1
MERLSLAIVVVILAFAQQIAADSEGGGWFGFGSHALDGADHTTIQRKEAGGPTQPFHRLLEEMFADHKGSMMLFLGSIFLCGCFARRWVPGCGMGGLFSSSAPGSSNPAQTSATDNVQNVIHIADELHAGTAL